MSGPPPAAPNREQEDRVVMGLAGRQRFRIYLWGAVALLAAFVGWALLYLQPQRWYKYTDQVAFEQVGRDVEPGFVLWEEAEPAGSGFAPEVEAGQPVVSSDGARLVYVSGEADGNADLFLRVWDGTDWGKPRPMRALNSNFHESAPALSGDGNLLYFASDRPGGRGGYDLWVSKWDGAEYAWPLPLTGRVNTAFDEIDPAPSPDNFVLYFASNRPRPRPGRAETVTGVLENVEERKSDYDLYSADLASETPFDLIVERQLSMLYSLREGALADPEVMRKLGGSAESETAVDKGLAYLARIQEEDGRWDIRRHGGQGGHDVAATAFALLAFYGRGEVHDAECQYRETVSRGLQWLLAQQNPATGDLRGPRPSGNAMYDHGIAALALVEAYGVTKDSDLRPKAQAAIDFIAESQHEEGGWRYTPKQKGDLSVTGWMVMALASAQMSGLRVEKKTTEGAATFLEIVSFGKNRGSYGYTDPRPKSDAMNAVGFFCAQLMGASANTLKAFESSHLLTRQGFKVRDLYYAYYGTLAAYQHQGPVWRNWMKKMHPEFLRTQARDGSWSFGGSHSGAMGKVIGTALVTLCLEAHYRYTPLYGLGWEPDENGPTGESVNLDQLPETPLYRHARHLATLSSPAEDTSPVVTDHGDFLYFASTRDGSLGGSDLYRSRVSGKKPTVPRNLGPEINSAANETHPAVRNAGFHLLFNSDRDENVGGLYSARSKRVVRRYDYSKMPSAGWLASNLHLLIALAAALAGFLWLSRRALAVGKATRTPKTLPEDPPPGPAA